MSLHAVVRCLDVLRRMQQSVSRWNQSAEIGLLRLYDVQLTAKYAYSGFLGNRYFNIVNDKKDLSSVIIKY